MQISQSEGAGSANVVVAAGADCAMFVEGGAVADETVLVVFALLAWRLGKLIVVVDGVFFGLEGVESGVDWYDEGRPIGGRSSVGVARRCKVFGAAACKVRVVAASASAAAASASASAASSLVFAGLGAHGCLLGLSTLMHESVILRVRSETGVMALKVDTKTANYNS